MNSSEPNLFNALFEFHPRDDHSPEENFLTEAFAHLLRTSAPVREAWVSLLFNGDLSLSGNPPEIQTRNSEIDDESGSIRMPDLKLIAVTTTGEPVTIFSEHKWNSPFNAEQLKSYARIAKKTVGKPFLVFVGAHLYQAHAAKACQTCMPCRVLLWEDVYRALSHLNHSDGLLSQFLSFMKTQGLSPGEPLTLRKMQAYVEAWDLLPQLVRYTTKLNGYAWSVLPERYRKAPEVRNRWGRVAIEFATQGWAPTITTGFLYSPDDHDVSFTAPGTGIDFFFRVECNPGSNPKPDAALAGLRSKVPDLQKLGATVFLKNQPGNGNSHTLLIALKNVHSVIGSSNSEQEQLDAIYQVLHSWAKALFGDGKLETQLLTLKG